MRMIAANDLTSRTDGELAVLFHMVSNALSAAKPGSQERRMVIASLQSISTERTQRHRQCTVPGF